MKNAQRRQRWLFVCKQINEPDIWRKPRDKRENKIYGVNMFAVLCRNFKKEIQMYFFPRKQFIRRNTTKSKAGTFLL